MSRNNEEKIIDQFIDELNRDAKPSAYQSGEPIDPELEKAFETVRAVKRLRESRASKRWLTSTPFKGALAAAAALLLVIGLSFFSFDGWPGQERGIVHAVVQAYEELQSYQGTVEIRSEKDGEVDYLETIEVAYQKPGKYNAVHRYDGHKLHYVSDGDSMVHLAPYGIEIENVFPEKELWRYHIGTAVWELKNAAEVNIVAQETLFGREATVIEYRYSEEEEVFHELWIDETLELPLRKVFNTPEGSLTVAFTELEVNPELDEDLFRWELSPEQKAEAEVLNRTGTLDEALELWPEAERLVEKAPAEMELERIGMLDDGFFELVLRFAGPGEEDFLDVYRTTTPRPFSHFSGSTLGRLGNGYVELNENTWNVFDLYIGQSSIGRWILLEKAKNGEMNIKEEIFLVSNYSTRVLQELLENYAGEEMESVDMGELLREGLEPSTEKEGH